jgi:hypothetical protein
MAVGNLADADADARVALETGHRARDPRGGRAGGIAAFHRLLLLLPRGCEPAELAIAISGVDEGNATSGRADLSGATSSPGTRDGAAEPIVSQYIRR